MSNVNTAKKAEPKITEVNKSFDGFLTSQVIRYDALKTQAADLAAEMNSIKDMFDKNLKVGENYVVDGKGFTKRAGAARLTEAAVTNALGNCPECYVLKFDVTAAKGALKVAGIEFREIAEVGEPTTAEVGFNK